jgi:hypothetical protein
MREDHPIDVTTFGSNVRIRQVGVVLINQFSSAFNWILGCFEFVAVQNIDCAL